MPNSVGSRSINIAPLSSRKLDMRPLKSAVKNVSGMQVNVWRDVENLKWNRGSQKQADKKESAAMEKTRSFHFYFANSCFHLLFATNIQMNNITTVIQRHFFLIHKILPMHVCKSKLSILYVIWNHFHSICERSNCNKVASGERNWLMRSLLFSFFFFYSLECSRSVTSANLCVNIYNWFDILYTWKFIVHKEGLRLHGKYMFSFLLALR